MGRRIENASEGITLQIEKKAESVGAFNAYIYLIMVAQLNIQNGAFVSVIYSKNRYIRTSNFEGQAAIGSYLMNTNPNIRLLGS